MRDNKTTNIDLKKLLIMNGTEVLARVRLVRREDGASCTFALRSFKGIFPLRRAHRWTKRVSSFLVENGSSLSFEFRKEPTSGLIGELSKILLGDEGEGEK